MLKVRAYRFNPFSENTYLLSDDDRRCWIVDPGMYSPEEAQAFVELIEHEGLQPQSILLTHAHLDHILGIGALQSRYGIPFRMHPLETPVLAAAAASAMMYGLQFGDVLVPEGFLAEGEPVVLGGERLEIILAPGHSPGSVCFYHAEEAWMIGGDVLFAGSIGRSDLPGGDGPTLLRSIREKILPLPDETIVYPGHGPATTIGEERETNPFLA